MEESSKVVISDPIPITRRDDRQHKLVWKGYWRRVLRIGPRLTLSEELKSWRGRVPTWLEGQRERRRELDRMKRSRMEKLKRRADMMKVFDKRRGTRLQFTAGKGCNRWRENVACGRFTRSLLTSRQKRAQAEMGLVSYSLRV